jgi:ribose/xylose/arabinose/galactoside ABC-type transport system permease subunit
MSTAAAGSASGNALAERLRPLAMTLVLAGFVAVATIVTSGAFLAPQNIANIVYQASIVGVLALAQTLVIVSRGLDLSVVATLILSAVIMGGAGSQRQADLMFDGALPFIGFWPALVAGFAAAGVVGLVNGILSSYAGIPSFIVTLATALLLSGLVLIGTGGAPIYYPDPFYTEFGAAKILGLPAPVYVLGAVTIFVGLLLSATTFGKRLYAVGANEDAARFSGINVARVRLIAFVICSLLAAVAGLLFLSRTGYVAYGSGADLLLTSVAAVVVGGVRLSGGAGGAVNAIVGVLLLTALGNVMNILVISPHLQYAINGAIILMSVMLHARIGRAEEG